jgi:hypothetical protein
MARPLSIRPGRLGDQTQQGGAGHGLAGAGLADDPEGLAFFEREADAVHRAIHAAARMKVGAEIRDFEQGHRRKE